MLEFIRDTLQKAMELSEKQVPNTKYNLKRINVDEVRPSEFHSFIKENNIPDDCDLSVEDNCIYIVWREEVETTHRDKQLALRRNFDRNAMKFLHSAVEEINSDELKYERKEFDYNAKLKRFGRKTIYDLYTSQDWEGLEDYFFLFFREVKE